MFNLALPWLLLALPLPLLMYWLPTKNSNQVAALKMPTLIQGANSQTATANPQKASRLFSVIIWCLLVFSASQPQWLGDAVNIPTEGREMMIAVDLSGSMQVEDMFLNNSSVNRLEMLKVLLGEFIERRTGDRLGLILFGDDAYMQTPMTFDRNTVQQMLDEAELGLVGQKTAIGDAIALAVKRFDEKKTSNRVLLLLTDGQNTAGKITPDEALELAIAKDITIYTIGIGADVMVQQGLFGSRKINPSSELDEASLKRIAQKTNGSYFRAKGSEQMTTIYHRLDELEPVEQEQQKMRPLTALFYWPLALALILSFVYLFMKTLFLTSNQKPLPVSENKGGFH